MIIRLHDHETPLKAAADTLIADGIKERRGDRGGGGNVYRVADQAAANKREWDLLAAAHPEIANAWRII